MPPVNPAPSTKKGVTVLLFFTSEPDRGTVESFEDDWGLYGPGDVAPLTFRYHSGRKAEWSSPLRMEDFDRVADLCDRWFEAGRLRKASLMEEDEFGELRRWNLRPKE